MSGSDLDHAGIALGQHAARGARQPRRVAMGDAGAFAAGGFQNLQSLALEAVAGVMRALVPGLARIVLLEAGAGVDDQQRADALGMGAIERQRHVAAQRQPADDGLLGADGVEQRGHVGRPSTLRCRRRDRQDNPTGRGRACPTTRACDASTAPRSGPATSRRSRNSRGSAAAAGRCREPRNGY